MTKRDLLVAICEQPGFEPEESSTHDRYLEELKREGWIQRRDGMGTGWEATPRALDDYPQFGGQMDIRDSSPRPILADASAGRKEELNRGEVTLPTMFLRRGQHIDMHHTDFDEQLDVTVDVRASGLDGTDRLREVEVTIRVREVQ